MIVLHNFRHPGLDPGSISPQEPPVPVTRWTPAFAGVTGLTAMKHEEFEVGAPFACGDRKWRCTDIGKRTVIAMRLDHEDDPTWYRGPPYAVAESVFDEDDQVACQAIDERVEDVRCDDHSLIVDLMDGRTISVPLAWYPRLLHATPEQRSNWKRAGAGYGIHWPDIDEDLSIEGLLAGIPSAKAA